ncbi:Gfo/Idh/MocA family protein [Actinoplanes sp. NPDC051859]|uniref:Gfo/Idh/MocA family protein n=1 Tax=Actinoplanes sp. NPDC051859 TaxID=3363909 RepID=UPI00379519B9
MTTTRWGILGTGRIAGTFAADLRHAPGAELAAVGSRSLDTAKAFAAEHDAARAHGSYAELAANPDVDVIYVATPHTAHYDATMACLAAGKPVLCEKPMTLELATSAQLVDVARAGRTFLMEAMWMRCNPAIRKIHELLRAGTIGDIVALNADLGLQGPFEATHRLRNPALGGGALLDLGVYLIHLAHLFLGTPSTVQSTAQLTSEGVDETTGILLGYHPRAIAALTCSIAGATRNGASITGTRGRIDLPAGFYAPPSFVLHSSSSSTSFDFPFEGSGYQFEAIEVQRCLAEGLVESPLVPHLATLEVMTMLDTVRAEIGVAYPDSPS